MKDLQTMSITDRRRDFLREISAFLVHISQKLGELAIDARAHAERAALLSMPDGAVEFRGTINPTTVPIQRNGITLIVPVDTPCDILDTLFEIAAELELDEPLDAAGFLAFVKKSRRL